VEVQQQQLPLDTSAPAKARRLVEPLAASLEYERLFDLRLLITELTANCVQHGGKTGALVVRVLRLERCVRLEVDCPAGETLPRIVKPGYRDGGGGVGLRIVDRLTEDWGVEREVGRTIVWALLAVS
jgi:anti-sigma regulatory factor (Ser/Thr protein kinase)